MNWEMKIFDIVILILAMIKIAEGIIGLLFHETTIQLKGERPVTIKGKWATIASLANSIFGILVASLILFQETFKTSIEAFNFWAVFCSSVFILFVILYLASRHGILANWRREY